MLFPQGSGALNPSVEAEFTIGAAVARGYTKMAVLYCVEDPGCATTVSAFEKPGTSIDGATTVYSSSISLTQPDFTAQCIAAKQAGATFVYFAGDSDSLNRMVGDCVAQGYNPIYDIDSLAVTSDLVSDPHLNGLLAGQSDFPWVDSFTPAQTTYQQAMKTYAPGLRGRPPRPRSGRRACWPSPRTRTSRRRPPRRNSFKAFGASRTTISGDWLPP